MTEPELGSQSQLCSACESPLILASLKGTAKSFSWGSSWPLLLTCAEAEAWLSLLGNPATADSRCCSNSSELDCWCIHAVFALLTCELNR